MQLFLYVHTHWDREWYLPFEGFRCQLPSLFNKVFEGLSSGSLPNFYLDGQAAILTDALDVAPELAGKIKEFMSAGRLSAGPWYVLADQMLVSGESLIRNLKLGIKTTSNFGTPAMIGYCPDTFGHSQDLPRILNGFGITNAIVWRGVPSVATSPVFWWQSPDGSRVLAYHLNRGYYQTLFHENKDTEALTNSLSSWLEQKGEANHNSNSYCSYIDGALCPVGGDHIFPPDNLQATIDDIQERLTDKNIDVWTVLPTDFIKLVSATIESSNAQLSIITGELRDNLEAKLNERAYLLPGVLSTRLYLKRANRLSEHRITNIIEPLLALLSAQNKISYPHDELDHAWKLLLQNQPHDSICGCSVDEVHNEMTVRTNSLNNVLDDLEYRARTAIANNQDGNPTLSYSDPVLEHNRIVAFNLSAQEQAYPVRMSWYEDLSQRSKKSSSIQIISSQERDQLFSGPGIVPYYKQVRFKEAWVWPGSVPGIGMTNIEWSNGAPKTTSGAPNATATKNDNVKTISNGIIEVEIDDDGKITANLNLDDKRQSFSLGHRLRDVGDGGDTYNFDPLPDDVPIEAKFAGTKIGMKGPLISSLVLTYELRIPDQVIQAPGEIEQNQIPQLSRSPKLITHKITTELSLRKNVPIVFFETTWENKSKDHRLEAVFDTGRSVKETSSENHFSLVKRQHTKPSTQLPVEIGCEAVPDRFPCQRFFIANDQLFLTTGLPEYAVDNDQIAITLLRAVSFLSRGRLRTRGGGAGPHLPTPEANCIGINRTSYAWAPLETFADRQIVQAYDLAEQFDGRLWATLSKNNNNPTDEPLITINNKSIRLVSLQRGNGANSLYLRLLNITNKEQTATLSTSLEWRSIHLCSLDGKPERELQADSPRLELCLQPNSLFTLCLIK